MKVFACFVAVIGFAALAQDRTAVFRESSVSWSEYRVSKLADGGAQLDAACGFVTDENSGERIGSCAPAIELTGANRTGALAFGNGTVLRAVKRELKVGDGGVP